MGSDSFLFERLQNCAVRKNIYTICSNLKITVTARIESQVIIARAMLFEIKKF